MAEERHEILGGKVQIYRRPNSPSWHCSASVGGAQRRKSTGEDSLSLAKQIAEDWYLELRGKSRAGLLKPAEKTFGQAADQFLTEYEVITEGQRSKKWTEGHAHRLRLHLRPFLGTLGLSEVTPGKVQEYRVHRMTTARPRAHAPQSDAPPGDGASPAAPAKAEEQPQVKPPSRSTLHDEIVTLRQVLKTAVRHGWLSHVPDLSPPYKTQGKIEHRPWFSPGEYKQLYEATRAYAANPAAKNGYAQPHLEWNAKQVHDYVLFMANTGLRPDEAMPRNLLHRDVKIVDDRDSGERILEIEVRGKRGVGFCKSMPMAVRPYERLLARALPKPLQTKRARRRRGEDPNADLTEEQKKKLEPKYPKPDDPVFPGNHIKLFNGILNRASLKLDRQGKRRTAYSLRHTYICMRLSEGADIYQIAKNCRTSVEMIEKFYAAHIKDLLNAAAINVRRPRQPSASLRVAPEAAADEEGEDRAVA